MVIPVLLATIADAALGLVGCVLFPLISPLIAVLTLV